MAGIIPEDTEKITEDIFSANSMAVDNAKQEFLSSDPVTPEFKLEKLTTIFEDFQIWMQCNKPIKRKTRQVYAQTFLFLLCISGVIVV